MSITSELDLDLLLHPLSFSLPSWMDFPDFIGSTMSPGPGLIVEPIKSGKSIHEGGEKLWG